MLIDVKGQKHGIVSLSEAIEIAKTASLDLVQVSPSDSDPIVCKLLDYGKYLWKKKSAGSGKTKAKEIPLKRLSLGRQQILEITILN